MSDTPRTDKNSVRFSSLCAPDDARWVPSEFARQLERDLTEARTRIKELAEAGNDLVWWFCQIESSQLSSAQSAALKQWRNLRGRPNHE